MKGTAVPLPGRKASMTANHILFQEEDKDTYVSTMLQKILGPPALLAAHATAD